jgi:valyl-tRNA synthetase
VEQDLAREGMDRDALDPGELAERAGQASYAAAGEIAAALRLMSFDVVVPPVTGVAAVAAVAEPARAAFVALYEAGLVERADTVAWRCPRCACSLGGDDLASVTSETTVPVLMVGLDGPGPDGVVPGDLALEVEHPAVELLGAVTAVGVPPGYTVAGAAVAGRDAHVPLLEQPVPVVEDPEIRSPVLLTPGHDAAHHAVAGRLGLAAPVLEEEPAPFAAREAALERLGAEGLVAAQTTRGEDATVCAHCGTVAAARLGPHWVVAEELGGPWCLERELWRGVALPVGWCAECAKATVGVASADLGSCGICFGELRPEPAVIDPLFVAAAWVAEVVRGDGAVFVAGGPQWLAAAMALALRVAAGPLSVLGAPA